MLGWPVFDHEIDTGGHDTPTTTSLAEEQHGDAMWDGYVDEFDDVGEDGILVGAE